MRTNRDLCVVMRLYSFNRRFMRFRHSLYTFPLDV